jgi:hypothetical protein
MNRREFLLGATGLATGLTMMPLVGRGKTVAAGEKLPWFDPTYAELPSLEKQEKGLDAEALEAQAKVRMLDGIPVSDLPSSMKTWRQ